MNHPVLAATLNQTVQFMGVAPETLYNAYLSSKDHGAMTLDGAQRATYYRPGAGPVAQGETGDELRAFEVADPDGKVQYRVTAKILKLVPGKLIVMSWRNLAWNMAVNPADVTDFDSTVVLTFKKNSAGAEIQFTQVNVPDYAVKLPDTGEVGPLSSIVNTHWSLVYWEPMKKYFQKGERR
jgi:uncharacterized protein YndB with AHSA1/START domain